jgi:hydrogenase maturation protein HypF
MAEDGRLLVDCGAFVTATVRDVLAGVRPEAIGARFHLALAESVRAVAVRVRTERGVSTVGLTGGVFQNALLTKLCSQMLSAEGFRVLVHRQVPASDGGLALGQVLVGSP